MFKVVLDGYHSYFFRVKVETVRLIGGRLFFAAMSGHEKSISSDMHMEH